MPPVTGRKVSDNGKPQSASSGPISPYWATSDGETVRLYLGEVRDVLARLPTRSVQCVVTSPPYWGLRSFLDDGHEHKGYEIGSEPSPDCGTNGQAQCGGCFVCSMIAVFRGVRRVLRDDGVLWLNLGDTYAAGSNRNGLSSSGLNHGAGGSNYEAGVNSGGLPVATGLPSGNLVGVPWRVALALQADGWVLRQDMIWCLSGGTTVYVRCQTGEKPMKLRDLSRLDPSTIKLWNGRHWTQLLGMSRSVREGDEIEVLLRSGEDIACTTGHRFPTQRGLLEAKDLRVGDTLQSCQLPEPSDPRDSEHVGTDAAWFAGLYLAEGCGAKTGKIKLSGHSDETARWERVRGIVRTYGGTCSLTTNGNVQTIRVYSRLLCAVVNELIAGQTCKNKGLSQNVWQYSNRFLEALALGYLEGDGHWDEDNQRWRIAFARNHNLELGLRTACARLGWLLTLNSRMTLQATSRERFPCFRGEIRTRRRSDGLRFERGEKDRNEIVSLRRSSCREVYDVGVEDEPHLFALASGILTHNSKPAPMPESVTNRCTKAHEYVFLLTKGEGYYCDMEAIKEPLKSSPEDYAKMLASKERQNSAKKGKALEVGAGSKTDGFNSFISDGKTKTYTPTGSNKRSVWTISSQGYPGAHFATFPPKLVEPCILAGTSEKGACAVCGAPWGRVVEKLGPVGGRQHGRKGGGDNPYNAEDQWGLDEGGAGANWPVKTTGWAPGCRCGSESVRPCVVLDPFIGSGTTVAVANDLGRWGWGIDLSEEYLRNHAIKRAEGALLRRPATSGLTGRVRQAVTGLGRPIHKV